MRGGFKFIEPSIHFKFVDVAFNFATFGDENRFNLRNGIVDRIIDDNVIVFAPDVNFSDDSCSASG